ncbi:uncharacterized kinase-like protein D1044.1 [Procambarus clarkii]|uniref:uncharacterized kinase-like protein D1044.1 n=1 Tax=Procambarus clarkii TaxID=6728 RepID=UPI0037432BB7
MTNNNLKTKESTTPHSLVTEDHVKKALLADKGSDALLESWVMEDFTKQGDNYACVVSSVRVKFSLHGDISEVVYIVKLNPCRNIEAVEHITRLLFSKEAKFYLNLASLMSAELTAIGHEPLRIPVCFHGSLESGHEILFLKDLRPRGFKMFDRRKGLDVAHTTLILQELARFHASSVLLEAKCPGGDLSLQHDYLLGDWTTADNMPALFDRYLENAIQMLNKVGGYKRATTWIESLRGKVKDIFEEQLGSRGKFIVVCHGDCWNNNVLFRYDNKGAPVEVMLLDLQVVRRSSPAADINYLLYTSLTGDIRKPNLDTFLSKYYNSFHSVLQEAKMDMPFTETWLLQEFREKNLVGALFAMMLVPMVLFEPEDVPDMSGDDKSDLEDIMNDFMKKGLEMIDTNPLMKPRFLAVFDEMMEVGIIP